MVVDVGSKFSKFHLVRVFISLGQCKPAITGDTFIVSVPVVNANFFFRGPIRSDDQPLVPHVAPLLHLRRSRESRVISSTLPAIHFVILPIHDVLVLPRRRCL